MNYKKYWQKPRQCVWVALLTLTACAPLKTVVSVPYPPLPAALAQPCDLPPKLTGNNADAALLALKVMYDLYGECAGRHYELIRYMSDKERL